MLGRQVESQIRGVEASYDQAWRAGDISALLHCLTEDAVLVNPRGEVARGHVEIRRLLGAFLCGEARGTRHDSALQRIELVTDDVAVVDGEARITALSAQPAMRHDRYTHRFTDVLVRQRGQWLIAHVRAYERHAG
jgi:uncharacterized protein (TIGR02246 family)